MKMAEEMEVKALDTWTAVHDKKRKAKEKEKMAEITSSKEEVYGHRKEEAREQNVQKSIEFQFVECNEKERRPKQKLQLLDEIMMIDTNVEYSYCNKNPKLGRKERNDHTTISEQMFETKKRSDEKIQKLPNRKGLVTIPRKDHLKQINSPTTLNAKTDRSVVSPINHTRGQKPCGQVLNGPVNFPARPVDSPYLSLIHISEPTRPLYISYAVFCLKKNASRPAPRLLPPALSLATPPPHPPPHFFNDTATTEIYTLHIVGSVRCV